MHGVGRGGAPCRAESRVASCVPALWIANRCQKLVLGPIYQVNAQVFNARFCPIALDDLLLWQRLAKIPHSAWSQSCCASACWGGGRLKQSAGGKQVAVGECQLHRSAPCCIKRGADALGVASNLVSSSCRRANSIAQPGSLEFVY
jgi:hypothetical protein